MILFKLLLKLFNNFFLKVKFKTLICLFVFYLFIKFQL